MFFHTLPLLSQCYKQSACRPEQAPPPPHTHTHAVAAKCAMKNINLLIKVRYTWLHNVSYTYM